MTSDARPVHPTRTATADQTEVDRLLALTSFAILDTPTEQAFDDLTTLAANLCGASMALVSLVDSERQWIKARHGVDLVETPREHSFCTHALATSDLMVVPDARLDSRFVDNPLVTSDPHLRFYAGAPLVTADGHALGTLCVLDTVPRTLTELQRTHLRVLAAQVLSQMEIRRQTRQLATEIQARFETDVALRAKQQMLDGVLEHTDVLIYAKDLDGRFVMTNPALELATQVVGGLLGRTDHELFPQEIADDYRRNDLLIVASGNRQVFSEDLIHRDGAVHTYRSTKFPLFDDSGVVIGIGGVSTDVTELAHSASTDPLTGTLNRRAWDTQLPGLLEVTVRSGAPLVIAVVDLDNFKTYNDTHGHNAGDGALRSFATAARTTLRGRDVFARWGGEEFILALPDTTSEQAVQILDLVRSCVPDSQTCSIGYTTWQPTESMAHAITRADTALYRAKTLGRDQLASG
ncbi:hypothetical protein BH09ACT7_BH09ACT7_20380 [soil metagenome]